MPTPETLDAPRVAPDGIVEDDPENGVFLRARRDMFTDEELFELEMKHVVRGQFGFTSPTSQIPNPKRLFHRADGPRPRRHHLRQDFGRLHARHRLSHRGAMLCRFAGQQGDLHLPVPRLTFRQHR